MRCRKFARARACLDTCSAAAAYLTAGSRVIPLPANVQPPPLSWPIIVTPANDCTRAAASGTFSRLQQMYIRRYLKPASLSPGRLSAINSLMFVRFES